MNCNIKIEIFLDAAELAFNYVVRLIYNAEFHVVKF
jgi:hypothetical protein